jgi:UDP:flavonoid glycosyltransferase YjiC (YdhE family)
MRVLFSSTRGAGHLQPLLPYARALVARKHEVVVAGPAELSEALLGAGLAHAPFDHPGDDVLLPIWARLRGKWSDEALAIALREIFAGVNSTSALPKLQATMRAFQPDLVVRDSVEFAALVAAEHAGVRHARVAVHSVSFEEPFPPLVDAPIDALRALAGLGPDEGRCIAARRAGLLVLPRVARCLERRLANAPALSSARRRRPAELRARRLGAGR